MPPGDGARVGHHGPQGDPDTGVRVRHVPDGPVDAVLPGPDGTLVAGVVLDGPALLLRHPLGVQADDALVRHLHPGVDGLLPRGPQPAAQVHELGVRVAQQPRDGLGLGLRVLELLEGDVEAGVGRLRAEAHPGGPHGDAVDVPAIGLLLPGELPRHRLPALRGDRERGEVGGHDLVVGGHP
ncbi:hypothetical protein GCM10020295_32730 [Streptomyces cinereospinus]